MGVLFINNNINALNAVNNLTKTDARLAKSIERLSSGLRINRASDDAAGLTISERLRGQISGLQRASDNAQDGISLIQTAEGSLNEASAILQRLRGLAVQAANGVLTTNDRQEIQREVDQLLDEIDRIANSTEFNTKRLLDGTVGGLISTDDPTKLRGVVVGNVGKGGNFVLTNYLIEEPSLQIQKSSVFNTIAGEDRVGIMNGEFTFLPSAKLQNNADSAVGLTEMVVQTSPGSTGSVAIANGEYRVTLLGKTSASVGSLVPDLFSSQQVTPGTDYISVTGINSGGISFASQIIVSAGLTVSALGDAVARLFDLTAAVSVAVINTDAGASMSRLRLTNTDSVAFFVDTVQFVDADMSGSKMRFGFDRGSVASSASFFSTEMTQTVSVSVFAGGATVNTTMTDGGVVNTIGDATTGQLDIRLDNDVRNIVVGAVDVLSIAPGGGSNQLQQFGNVTQVSTPSGNYTFRVRALTNSTYTVENLTTGSIAANIQSINAAGTEFTLGLDSLRGIVLGFDATLNIGETAIFHSSTNNVLVAQHDTELQSIARFRDLGIFDGRDSLELRVNFTGDRRATEFIVNATDTIEILEGKLSLAIANPNAYTDLNLEGALGGGNWIDLVHFNLTGPAKGTFSIVSPDPTGEIVLSGDEKLLIALGLMDIETRSAPVYSVVATDIHTGEVVGSVRTNTNHIEGLLQGVDILFDTTVGFRLDPDPGTLAGTYGDGFSYDRTDLEGLAYDSDAPNKTAVPPYINPYERPTVSITSEPQVQFIHIAPNQLTLQIGANQGQTLDFDIQQLDTGALGIDTILVVTPDTAQRALTQVDDAINLVASQRSKLGAIQNRLESTIRNLNTAAENLTASESRIRDLNLAQQTIDFTKDQILLQSGTAVLAQANQLPQTVLQLLR